MTILNFSEADLNYQTCYDAHRGVSHTPEERAKQEIAQYLSRMQEVSDTFTPFATPTNEASLKFDLERYRQGYLKRLNARLSAMSRVYSSFIAGPSNFPVARMEKRNNTLDKRSKELLEYQDKALKRLHKDYNPVVLARAPIRSDEANAIEQLQAKIKAAAKFQETMKSVNKVIRNKRLQSTAEKVSAMLEIGLTEQQARELLQPDFAGRLGFSYQLKNNNANIKSMKQRLASLQAEAERPEVEDRHAHILGTPVTIIENRDITRLQLAFNGKPPTEVRKVLKNNGFNWSPTEDAWQRLLNQPARYAVKNIIDKE